MKAYINGIGVITSQDTSNGIPAVVGEITADYLKCLEPDYKQYINPIAARRMSRLIKMGITAARQALTDAGLEMPDAVITGTGLGSVEDTEKLLKEMHSATSILNPTPFIQSTYNTISSQIAINLKCHNYNSTYVHRAVSFESALQDGLMQLDEGMANDILAGGIDELTPNHLHIIRKLGHWKREPASNLHLTGHGAPGALAGEGAAFVVAGTEKGANCYCRIEGLETFYHFTEEKFRDKQDVDLLLMGYNGDPEFDGIYDRVSEELFPGTPVALFKHISGEYYTASGIGLWLAANVLKRQEIPSHALLRGTLEKPVRKVLLYNQYRDESHALFTLSAI